MLPLTHDTIALPMGTLQGDPKSALLLAVGELLHREIAIDDLLDRLVDRISEAMAADRGTIYLVDRGRGQVFSRAAHLPELEEIRLALGQGVAGYVAEHGEVVNVPTATDEERFYEGVDQQTGYHTESILAVPLQDRRGAIIGVVQLLNKEGGPFTRDDERLLARLADQAAMAIEATTLYEDLIRAGEGDHGHVPISGQFNRIVGESELLVDACRLTKKAAASEATVLLRGESGTGKELFARAVHVNSSRAAGPFVKVDCAALPESLIDNELFGHERGAYTGADRKAPGKLDAAQGGTLFLDEIGELPLAVQGKLLRLLQDREYLPVGGTEPVCADVRIVAATNRDLEAQMADGRFRSDLYYRLKVIPIVLPPLRHRGPKDIERLARHFAVAAARRHGRPSPRISPAALVRLCAHRWPGNVRELENCIESAVVIMDGAQVEPQDLPLPERPLGATPAAGSPALTPAAPPAPTPAAAAEPGATEPADQVATLAEVERGHILAVMERCEGNRTRAAQLLGIGRNTLTRKLKRYGL